MVELENKKFNIQIGMLGVGCLALLANLFLNPFYALYVNGALAGSQAFLLMSLVQATRELRKAPRRQLTLIPATKRYTPPTRWPNTNELLAAQELGGEIVLLEAVMQDD